MMRLAIYMLVLIHAMMPVAWAQTPLEDMLVLKMDWNPSSCAPPSIPCQQSPFGAFTMSEMGVYDGALRGIKYDCPTNVANASADIPGDVEPQLACTLINSAAPAGSSNVPFWNGIYGSTGSCTGFPPSAYFRLFTESYNNYNPNIVMTKNNIQAGSTVDRDTFISQLSSTFGAKAWIECDGETRNLKTAVVCLGTSTPHDPVDCPWSPTNPASASNGLKCAGSLNLPIATEPATIKVPGSCARYLKSAYSEPPSPPPSSPPAPTATPTPLPPSSPTSINDVDGNEVPPSPPPSSSSSSNIGAIVGGVIAGLAVVAAIVGGIIFMKKKKSAGTAASGMEQGAAYNYVGSPNQPNPQFASVPPTMGSMQARSGQFNGNPYLYGAAAGAGAGAAGAMYGSHMTRGSGSQPSSPATPYSNYGVSTANSVDPLMEYINSTLSGASAGTGTTARGPLAAWQLNFQDITIERPIGEGSWGRVYKGNWNQTEVAVKILLDTSTGNEANATQSALMAPNNPIMARLEQEANIMTNLHHPNIVQFLV